MKTSIVLDVNLGDFVVAKHDDTLKNNSFFTLGIEGYIGLKSIEGFIDLYKHFREELLKWLESNYPKEPEDEKTNWKTLLKVEEMEVAYSSNHYYWIFTEGKKTESPWELLAYMDSLIRQLTTLSKEMGEGVKHESSA